MSTVPQTFAEGLFAADAARDERAAFLRRTYAHLFGAILVFIGLEGLMFHLVDSQPSTFLPLMQSMVDRWWIVLLAFVGVSWLGQHWAHQPASQGMQYAGLALFTVAEAVIFAPLLYIAREVGGQEVIPLSGIVTLVTFAGLTAVVFLTGADFSFLRGILWVAALAALAAAIGGALFAFPLGMWFAGAMVVLAAGFILYDTSNVLHHYRTDQHVGAALELFASVALLFWYVLRIVMSFSSRD
jgi:hypothetical protein